jgi:SPP1 gp7 family putative phage head morphogenesis protein
VNATRFQVKRRIEIAAFNDINRFVQARLRQIEPEDLDPAFISSIQHEQAWQIGIQALMQRMVLHLDVENARSWAKAANKAMRGREIHAAIQAELAGDIHVRWREIADAHSAKIVSLPDFLAWHAAKKFQDEAYSGRRSRDIAEDIKGTLSSLAEWHVKMLARTEVGSAQTALTRARSERLNIDWYAWETSQDVRVRQSHRMMTGVLVNWGDPPAPEALLGIKSTLGHYHASQCPNCRCNCLPLISLSEVKWPAQVYYSGTIQRMSRKQFAEFAGVGIAA